MHNQIITLEDLDFVPAPISEEMEFYLPKLTTEAVDQLLREYAHETEAMSSLHAFLFSAEQKPVLMSFAAGAAAFANSNMRNSGWALDLVKMFDLTTALSATTEGYWQKVFSLCNFDTILPATLFREWQQKLSAWREGLSYRTDECPGILPFDRETVYTSLHRINSHRGTFFAMRVEGVWQSLSSTHKTNAGSNFHERMIIDNMFNDWGSTTGKAHYFQDLINIVSTVITGADSPFINADSILTSARKHTRGEWVDVLDGALRVRCYKAGTAHCEVHPEVANRLNECLAYLYPDALPTEVTTKRPRKKSGFGSADLFSYKVAPQVRQYLLGISVTMNEEGFYVACSRSETGRLSRQLRKLIDEVMAQVGGVAAPDNSYLFDYDAVEVLKEIYRSGEVPEKESHQFYPTPTALAQQFVDWVGLNISDVCYETSAGTGNIAKLMPLQTYCVEVSKLRAMALDKQGFEVKHGDFMALSPADLLGLVDSVLMNPPFSGRQWQDHFEHAVSFVHDGGTIGAILPAGAVHKMPELLGRQVIYSQPLHNQFSDASISVVFAKWVKPAETTYAPKPSNTEFQQVDLFAA